jgi:hypothetical protein
MTPLTPEAAAEAVSRFALMAFFPGDIDTRAALIWALLQFVEFEEQLDWLVERGLKSYSRWPGLGELRALYCSRFRPKDGMEAYSEVYQFGFPHESRQTSQKPLARERRVSADGGLDGETRRVANAKTLGRKDAGRR